jgi:hypothetical protein
MRRMTSPSALFGIWTLLFFVPVLAIVIRRTSEPLFTYYVSLPSPEILKPFAVLAALMPVLRFAPLSYPFFAVVYAAWPLVTRRSLDAVLGRWQFGLATAPAVLSVFLGAMVVGWNRWNTAGSRGFETTVPDIVAIETILFTVAAFWLISVALFCFNVFQTLRDRSRSTASP